MSNSSVLSKTGFGKHAKTVLTELYKKGYEIIELACGYKYSEPQLLKTPWKAFGTLPDSDDEIRNMQANELLFNAAFFGHFMIDKIIRDEKPDVIILVEDIWKVSHLFQKPWWNKIPTVVWTPVDSEPPLPVFKDEKAKLTNLWVKAPFAQRSLKEIGVESEMMPLLLDKSYFKPDPDQRKELRRLFGLEDSFVIGFVFRNQIRKLVGDLLKGFKEFKDKYDVKAKLYLHTNFAEYKTGGWNIEQLMQKTGVDKSDVLATYVCRHCKTVQILPFSGEQLNCNRCMTEGSLMNPAIDFGVTEEELNACYNIMDMYCHPATSGGFEAPMLEASLVGLPTACPNYSFGETFCNAYSIPIEWCPVDEISSGFTKSQPLPGSVCNAIETVYLNQEQYKKVGLQSREWALQEFDVDKHISRITNIIDGLEADFDYDFFEIKNVDYPPNYSLSDAEFVLDLYKGIWGMDLSVNNHDVKKFIDALQVQSREEIVKQLKRSAEEYNQQQNPPKITDFIVKSDRKKICLVIPEGYQYTQETQQGRVADTGELECFAALTIINEIKKKYPDWDHYISVAPENVEFFQHLELTNIIPFHPSFNQPYFLEGRSNWEGVFDVALQPYLNPSWVHNGLA